jgi:secondary thiamine-phosphate synthase enzyme
VTIQTHRIAVSSRAEGATLDITEDVRAAVTESGITAGTATVFVPGSTGGVTTIEFEPGCVEDLGACLERLAPRGVDCAHEAAWHDGNGHSHVRAALLGPSLTVPVVDGGLTLGTWQQIVFVDFDNRPRRRELIVQVVGE